MNKALIMDLYELTMANSYFNENKKTIAYFDYFFRTIPDNGGYVILAGITEVIDYLLNLEFSIEEINFLRSKKLFTEDFLKYLKNFKFKGDMFSLKEGSIIYPGEPIITIRASLIDAQIIETFLLMSINHMSLIATKASRICYAAQNRDVMEFGARRAHNIEASILGAKAAYLGGCVGSSNIVCDYLYGIPSLGTMAHSYITSFNTEYEAFLTYAKTYPNNVILLLDTYDTLKSGLVNAIKLYKEYLLPKGLKLKGLRIDSGDISYLSKAIRKELIKNNLADTLIIASNSLDEYIIQNLIREGAEVDIYAVGEKLITAYTHPILDGVYKLVALEENGKIIPKIKISNNFTKTTTPGFKKVYRIINEENKMIADLIALYDEDLENNAIKKIKSHLEPWLEKEVSNCKLVCITDKVISNGKLVIKLPSINDSRLYIQEGLSMLWDEQRRLVNPHQYIVDLSPKLGDLKTKMLQEKNKN